MTSLQIAPLAGTLRVLFVAPYVPSPIRVRPYQLLRALVRRGHAVTLVCAAGPGDEEQLAALRGLCSRVVAVPHSRLDALRAYLRAIPGDLPLQAAHCLSDAFVAAVRAAAAQGSYDVVHVEHLRGAEVAHAALAPLGDAPPVLLDAVDCISLLFERALRGSPALATRAMALADLARTRRYEAGYFARVAGVIVTSPEDCWALRTLQRTYDIVGDAPATVVPNGVDLDYFRPTGEPREPATLVFSGKMSYHANHTAALYLLNEVMPLVWRERRDVRVLIVGAGPAPTLQRLAADPRVIVTGYVPDLRPYLARATIAVCPIRYGVGVQNKVLEALAMGAPVITARQTTVALAQLTGRELLVADNAAEFAVGVMQLLGQPEARELLGATGRAYVEAQYSWDRSAVVLERCYRQVIAVQQPVPASPARV